MHILFVTPRFPYPPEKGDQIPTYRHIRGLSERHRISLLSLCRRPPAPEALAEMRRLCARVEVVPLTPLSQGLAMPRALALGQPLQVGMHHSRAAHLRLRAILAEEPVDIVHAVTLRAADCTLFPKLLPTVVDFIDCLSLSYRRRARRERGLMRCACVGEAALLRRYERRVCRAMDAGAVVSEVDRDALGSDRTRVIPLGVDAAPSLPGAAERDLFSLIFAGNMSYFPNDDAARYLAAEILPRVWEEVPQARVRIVGRRPTPACRRLADEKRIIVTGEVPDVGEYLARSAVAVCPLRCGAGMQNKILEAMAYGVPVVATSFALGGLAARNGEHILVADSPEGIAQAVLSLLRSASERERIGRAGYALVRARYSWESATAQLEELYQQVLQRNRGE